MAMEGSLWMGKVEPYMDENFIRNAFKQMGENILGVKMMKDKSGKPAGYCFVAFPDKYSALVAMHRLHEKKLIPGSQPPVKFELCHRSLSGKHAMKNNYLLYIGNLSPEVDNCTLFEGFFQRYPSVRRAYVSRDETDRSMGYGFVRFASEEEMKKALIEMNGCRGIGSKAINVQMARRKNVQETNMSSSLRQAKAVVQAMWSGQPQPTTSAITTQNDYNQNYEQNAALPAMWNGPPHPSTSATTTEQDDSQYYWQYWNYYASPAQRPNYGNFNTAYPTYDYAQQQSCLQQPDIPPQTYQDAGQPAPLYRRRKASLLNQRQDDDTKPAENDGPARKKRK